MAIASLTLENFTVFESVRFDFVAGVNVLIGSNGTGKTHAMKAAYAALRASSQASSATARTLEAELEAVFRPLDGKVGRLARRRSGAGGNNSGTVSISLLNQDKPLTFSVHSKGAADASMVRVQSTPKDSSSRSIFVPPHELLASFEGFIAAYEARELSYDKTYVDLAVALSASKLRVVDQSLSEPLKQLRSHSGEILLKDGRFFLRSGGATVEAPLEAEGLRKVGTLVRLIETGAVVPGSVLFWDEPEANLNPRLSAAVVDAIVALAAPAQVVLATHDYLVARRLSLLAETGKSPAPIRFFSFSRPSKKSPATVTWANSLSELDGDVLTEAFMDQMNYEFKLSSRRSAT